MDSGSYPSPTVEQRQRLIPTLARILTNYPWSRSINSTVDDQRDVWPHGSASWFEERLRSSMTQAAQSCEPRPARAKRALWCAPRDESMDDIRHVDKRQIRGRHGQPPTQEHNHATNGHQLHLTLAEPLPLNTDLTMSSQDPCQVSVIRTLREAAVVAAERAAAGNRANYKRTLYKRPNRATPVSRTLADQEHLACVLTQANPICGENVKIDEPQDVIGPARITHSLHSTFPGWERQGAGDLSDILIDGTSRASRSSSPFNTTTEEQGSDEDILQSVELQQVTKLSTDTPNTKPPHTMQHQDSRQSLSEVLGDDQFLWSMWKRRASTCPPGEDEAEQLHNMFASDPDMKIFSPSRDDDFSYSDPMMFDSFDFSRKSTNSSVGSPSSYASSSFEQLERTSPYACMSQTPSDSRSTLSSTRETKEHRRRSATLKKAPRSSRMSEDDIVYQQKTSSRSIDIKSRKSTRDYARA